MQVKHSKSLILTTAAAAIGLLSLPKLRNYNDSNPSNSTNNQDQTLAQASGFHNLTFAKVDEKSADFSDLKTIDSHYPDLTETRKQQMHSMIKECEQNFPEFLDKLKAALKIGISPKLFEELGEDDDFEAKLLTLLDCYDSLLEDASRNGTTLEKAVLDDRLIREANLLSFNTSQEIQSYISDGRISNNELIRALNSEDLSQLHEVLFRPITEQIRILSPDINIQDAQSIARYLSLGNWLVEKPFERGEDFSGFLKDYLGEPRNQIWLKENLATIRDLEQRATSIEGLNLSLLSQADIYDASNILGALESGKITATNIQDLVQLRGKHGLSLDDADILHFLSESLSTPDSEAKIRDFLTQVKENETRMANIGGDSHDLLSTLNPGMAAEVLDRLPTLNPKDAAETDQIYEKVNNAIKEIAH